MLGGVLYEYSRTYRFYEFSGGVLARYALAERVSLMNLGFNMGVVCPKMGWVPSIVIVM